MTDIFNVVHTDYVFQASILYAVPPVVLLLGQHGSVTSEHFQSLRIICNGAGPVKEADAERILARSNNKNLRFCQGKSFFYPI